MLVEHAFQQETSKQRKYVPWVVDIELILENDQCFGLETNDVDNKYRVLDISKGALRWLLKGADSTDSTSHPAGSRKRPPPPGNVSRDPASRRGGGDPRAEGWGVLIR